MRKDPEILPTVLVVSAALAFGFAVTWWTFGTDKDVKAFKLSNGERQRLKEGQPLDPLAKI